MLGLNELEIFLEAADLGNFSEAARRLHISQPAISQVINHLEKHINIELFIRQGRSVRLTEAGQALRPMARELLSAARRLDETMASPQGEVVGELNNGCSTTSGEYLLPGLIARFRRIYPDDLLDEPIIMREEVAGTLEIMLEGLQQNDISPDMLNVTMMLGNAEAIEMAVEEGIGIAFISRLAAARGLALGRIVEVEVEGMSLSRNLYLVRNRRFPATRAQSEFWNFFVTADLKFEKTMAQVPT